MVSTGIIITTIAAAFPEPPRASLLATAEGLNQCAFFSEPYEAKHALVQAKAQHPDMEVSVRRSRSSRICAAPLAPCPTVSRTPWSGPRQFSCYKRSRSHTLLSPLH